MGRKSWKKKRGAQQRAARWAMMRGMEARGCTKDEVLAAAAKMKKQQTGKTKKPNKDKTPKEGVWDRSQPYALYLISKWWKNKRLQKLHSTQFRCERCGGEATQVHHKHYRTLNCEKNTDFGIGVPRVPRAGTRMSDSSRNTLAFYQQPSVTVSFT